MAKRVFEGERPPADRREKGERTVPGSFDVRTRFLYSPHYDSRPAEDQPFKAYSHGSSVTASDWPGQWDHQKTAAANLERALASFGDDADLVITVALRNPPTPVASA